MAWERKAWSSTRLGLVARHCPRALDFADADTPRDRSIFETGIAAHHILQAVGEHQRREDRLLEPEDFEAIAANVLRHLVAEGRLFEGRPEPPLGADRAAEGMDLALAYLDFYPLPIAAEFERGLGVDENWEPVEWGDPERWFGAILDVVYETEDFATEVVAVVAQDYKTSWAAQSNELDTLQRKAQATVLAAHYPDVDELWLEVINLRTLQTYRRVVPTGSALIGRWRAEIKAVVDALSGPSADERRLPVPGAGCRGCPYLLACPEGQDYFERAEAILGFGSAEERARAFGVAVAMVGRLREELKPVCGERGSVVAEGTRVGYVVEERRKPKKDAGVKMLEKWESRGGDARGLMAAAPPGMSQLGAAARALWPEAGDRDRREKFVESLTEPDNRATFKAMKIDRTKGKEEL